MDKDSGISAPRVGAGGVVIRNDRVLLVKRGAAPNKGTWAIPGGSVEWGETLKQAVEREIKEETGLTVSAGEPVAVFEVIEKNAEGVIQFHYVIVDLAADYVSGQAAAADDAAEVGWFSAEELQGMELSRATVELLHKVGFL